MTPTLPRRLLPALLCAMTLAAAAQPLASTTPTPPATAANGPRRADPLDARAPVPPVRHVPLLVPARRPLDVAAVPWREANDTTARIGGWKAYAREAQPAEARP